MNSIVDLITGPGGALIFALVVLWAGWKTYWVFGWVYKDAVEEKKEWKNAAMRGVTVAERVVKKVEKDDV